MDAILADYADEIYSEGNHKKSYNLTLESRVLIGSSWSYSFFHDCKIHYWYQTLELQKKKKKIIAIGIDIELSKNLYFVQIQY